MDLDLLIEIIGATIGLTYFCLEYKAHIALWYVGILMSLFYIYIFLSAHFYADFAIYAYYLFANTYGLIVWLRKEKTTQVSDNQNKNRITHWKVRQIPILGVLFGLCWALIWFVLTHLPSSASPIGDSFTTALSIIAMWLMAQKQIEHWFLWFVVNVVSTILYVTKGLYPTAILTLVYSLGSVLGYYHWKRKMLQQEDE